jgi:heme/copper-type cytochrome/quinol oxidase subunit 3
MPKTAATALAEQFEHPKQQEEASSLGIWTFLSTEILFFGGLFLSYGVYRVNYPEGFAEGSRHLYFALTGLHAVHMTLGLSALSYLYIKARRESFSESYHTPVKIVGLYWHFVDVVWVFLYPMLYLIGKSSS